MPRQAGGAGLGRAPPRSTRRRLLTKLNRTAAPSRHAPSTHKPVPTGQKVLAGFETQVPVLAWHVCWGARVRGTESLSRYTHTRCCTAPRKRTRACSPRCPPGTGCTAKGWRCNRSARRCRCCSGHRREKGQWWCTGSGRRRWPRRRPQRCSPAVSQKARHTDRVMEQPLAIAERKAKAARRPLTWQELQVLTSLHPVACGERGRAGDG